MGFLKNFALGIRIFFQALELLFQNKKLLLLSLLPIAITLILYIFVISKLTPAVEQILIGWFESFGIAQFGFLLKILSVLVHLLMFFLGAFTFTFASSILASPFNDFLAEHAEKHTRLEPCPSRSVRESIELIVLDLAKTMVASVCGIFVLLVSWVPILNLFGAIMLFLLVTFQMTTYPQTRRKMGVFESIRWIQKNFFLSVGFGMMSLFFLSIPVLASFFLPVCVVGGTLLFAKGSENA